MRLPKAWKCLVVAFKNLSLHLWFKMSAARREDYELVQEEIGLAKHKFLKHVECRWLSLHPALLRILQQMNGLKRYFLTVLPEKQSSSTSNARCIRTRRQLESKDLVAQIHFLVSVADIFNPFLKFFQTEEPLFHLKHGSWGFHLKRSKCKIASCLEE